MSEEQEAYERVFGAAVLPELFPELRAVAHQEAILITIFDALCWQIRLRLLDPHSIDRIGLVSYFSKDLQYRIINLQPLMSVTISFCLGNANRRGYGDLPLAIREALPDRGMWPPQTMLMLKDMVIKGDEPLVRSVYDQFCAFVAPEQQTLLVRLKRFARERLIDQAYPHLSLREEVAEFYGITGS